jgi:hypothetical protein
LGKVLLSLRQYQTAEDALRQGCDIDSGSAQFQMLLGAVLIRRTRHRSQQRTIDSRVLVGHLFRESRRGMLQLRRLLSSANERSTRAMSSGENGSRKYPVSASRTLSRNAPILEAATGTAA